MGRLLVLVTAMLFSISAFASLSAQDVIKTLKGRYQIVLDGTNYTFLIRSSGDVQVLTQDEVERAELVFAYTSSSWGMDGLPVAHLTFLTGSDEDSKDYHVLLTVEEDWSGPHVIKLITTFSTFNDGPNEMSNYLGQFNGQLKKYSTKTKKYFDIK